jgi:hypothetical protein
VPAYTTQRYLFPDFLAHVYVFAQTAEIAGEIAREANRLELTMHGKFVAGSFVVTHVPGRLPAVTGTLTGN